MENKDIHEHQFTETIVPPTCKENGYTLYTCACGYERKSNFKPVGEHTFQFLESTPAGCTEGGEAKAVCSACGLTQIKTFAPLGHNYSQWVVQEYPTCTEDGSQVRRCSRCAATEYGAIPAIGHRRAPGTARRVDGAVEYFCENCGQTVRQLSREPEAAPERYLPTKIFLLLGVVMSFLHLIFKILFDLDPVSGFSSRVLTYSQSALMMAWLVILFLAAGKIKRNERYTKWMGVAMMTFAIRHLVSAVCFGTMDLLRGYVTLGEAIFSNIRGILLFVLFLFVAIVFFCGAKKKTGPFVATLSMAAFLLSIGWISIVTTALGRYFVVAVFYIPMTIIGMLAETLLWVGILLLMKPGKKRTEETEDLLEV